MDIPVVFSTDENYLFYTVIAITSMAEHAGRDTVYRIYLLVSGKLEKGHPLLTQLQERYGNISIHLLSVGEDAFGGVHINNPHVTKATFYRLLLSELLQDDICIYLDSDVIVNTDLQQLFRTQLGDAYIGGVRDLWIDFLPDADRERRRERSRIPSMDQYVNAGVLLFNLKSLRRDHMAERFRAHMKIDYPYEDQDILNVCCYDRIVHLPARWNLFTLFMGRLGEMEKKGIDRNTVMAFGERKGIIHYATPFIRPWESRRFLCNDIWWEYAGRWQDSREYREMEKSMERQEAGYGGKRLAAYCRDYKTICIWGFTEQGRKIYASLQAAGVAGKICFIDMDPEKRKFTYCGIPVLAFLPEAYIPGKILYILAGQRSGNEVRRMLRRAGIRDADIVRYIRKDVVYYQCLRPEFNEEEDGNA